MRVLLVTDGIYPFAMGGMQKHSYYLAKFLSAKGVQVHVVHCAGPRIAGNEMKHPAFKGCDERILSFQVVPFPAADRWPGHYLRSSRKYSEHVFDAVKDIVSGYDLVYAQGFTGLAFIRAKSSGSVHVPVVANLHGYEMFQKAPSVKDLLSSVPLRAMAREVSSGADAVFSFGGKITGILQRMGIPGDRILECPIGIEERWVVEAPASPVATERVFAFVGRDERRKGVAELTRALNGVTASGRSGFHFHLIGPVAGKHRLDPDRIICHGAVTDEASVQRILRSADVLVCPSWSEGMPTVIMEAMASGLAIIATDVGAVSQQVKDNGWLLEGPRPEWIRSAMEQVLAMDDQDLMRMKQRSLVKVRAEFTWENVISRKIELLDRVLRPGRNIHGGP